MDLRIYKAPADFNKSPYGNSKLCVIVEFPNYIFSPTGKPFKWFPSYAQLEAIKQNLKEIEQQS